MGSLSLIRCGDRTPTSDHIYIPKQQHLISIQDKKKMLYLITKFLLSIISQVQKTELSLST